MIYQKEQKHAFKMLIFKEKEETSFFNDFTVHLTKESIPGFGRKNPMARIKSLTLVALNNEFLCLRRKRHFLEKL